MKKLLIAIFAVGLALCACNTNDKDTWDTYTDWRNLNNEWLKEQQTRVDSDGTPYYKMVLPSWNPGAFVLVHYFNDRALTEGNLSPLYTSTVDTRYYLHLYDGTPVDSSVTSSAGGVKGVYRAQLNNLVQGWAIAMSDMRCGDTAEVIIPYGVAYGAQENGHIKPYSNLRFNIRLVDIPYYEVKP